MLGYIAFCPHFHQPHFQLARTRDDVYANSYEPWMGLLEDALASFPSFCISLHFSGPLLYWLKQARPGFTERLARIAGDPRIGFTGGLADEPFIQLSSRSDDFYFQMMEYDRICQAVTGIGSSEWQAVHMVERECGEHALLETSRAARLCQARPVYYLDAETFFPAYYTRPGAADDLCRQHFGFADPYSATTCAHLPPELLMFPFRDEIGGQEFFVIPVHSQLRYQLLKRQPLIDGDHTVISPRQYIFYIKDRLEKAARAAARLNRNQPPIALIFEDAEKLGQWSQDPAGDTAWLREFFALVEQDPQVNFTTPRCYLDQHGFLSTYPVFSSHSYPEWEKWTARRGIRGLNLADERLRKTLARLRDAEALQAQWEEQILARKDAREAAVWPDDRPAQRLAVLNEMMSEPERELYSLFNRVRNLAYQEDPKWASRHPSYGAAPYYDTYGLACLETALELVQKQASGLGLNLAARPALMAGDWDHDGAWEWVLTVPGQTVVISQEGGCIAYYHHINSALLDNPGQLQALLKQEADIPGSAGVIARHAGPLVLTEIDSELSVHFYTEGGRVDRCRNSMRCEAVAGGLQGEPVRMGFDTCNFELQSSCLGEKTASVTISARKETGWPGQAGGVVMNKTFTLSAGGLSVEVQMLIPEGDDADWQLMVEAVTSTAPSDELDFQPESFVGFNSTPGPAAESQSATRLRLEADPDDYEESYVCRELPGIPGQVESADYVCKYVHTGGSSFYNSVQWRFQAGAEPHLITIKPAVKNYLSGLVQPAQSRMGYRSSGLMLELARNAAQGAARIGLHMTRFCEVEFRSGDFSRAVFLTGGIPAARGK